MILLNEVQRADLLAAYVDREAQLVPVFLGHGVYGLPERVLADPEHAAEVDLLAGLPVGDPVAAVKEAALAAAAALRWQHTLFFAYDGVANAYADPAIAPLAAKILALDEAASDAPVNFKLSGTVWRSWTRTQLRAYGAAIDAHIQACFDHEKALSDAIDAAADLDALRAIDVSAGWP